MKQHIIVGLLTIFVLAPVVEVFSASMDPGPFLTPKQQEELVVQQQGPSTIAEFPFAPNRSDLGLTFRIWITIRTDTPVSIRFSTTGEGTIVRGYDLQPFDILAFGPAEISCPPEVICQVQVSAPGTNVPFAAVLEILMGTTSVDFLPPTFYYTTGGG